MFAEALRDLLVGDAESLDEAPQSARFFDRVEVGALQVLDEPQHELLVVPRFGADNRRHRVEPGQPGSAPAALARDQLVTVGKAPDEQRLQNTVKADGFRELTQRLGVKSRPDLLARGADLVDRDHLRHQRIAFARHWDEGVESTSESARPWLAHRSSSSFASAR